MTPTEATSAPVRTARTVSACLAYHRANAVADAHGVVDTATLSVIVDACADSLRVRGIQPGEPVAVRVPPSAAGIGAVLGVWLAGGVLVPLDPTQPLLRQQQILDAVGVRLVISAGADTHSCAVTDTGNPARTIGAGSDAAYVIHTSGSTGVPKGVVCTHTALVNVVRAQRDVFQLGPADRVAQLAPWCVDAFLFEVLLALTAGARLDIAKPDDRYPGPPVERFLGNGRATTIVATPSVLRALDPHQLPDLRLVISAGEALPPDLARTWAAGHRLVNAYGVTEATIWSTYAELDEKTLAAGGPVLLGQPIPGCSLTILDPHPDGAGELCIAGDGLALGYLDRKDLTTERFPIGPHGRVFRTGDLVIREDPDHLRFVGRDDEQVKLGGLRVELGEVRHVLTQHPDVHDCAVRQDGNRLVAYVVPAVGAVHRHALTEWMEQRLPIQMVPSLYVPMTKLSLTAWGKLDITALPSPADAVAAQQEPETEPESSTQTRLAHIASELLDLPSISLRDDLFLLGMTSLTMARFLRRVIDDLHAEIEPIDVFENPTIAELAVIVDKHILGSSA